MQPPLIWDRWWVMTRLRVLTAAEEVAAHLRKELGRGDERLEYMLDLRHELMEAGHAPFYADRTQHELEDDPERLSRLVERNEADAWVLCSGSHQMLAWFAEQEFPAMALFGYGRDLPIARVGAGQGDGLSECDPAADRARASSHRAVGATAAPGSPAGASGAGLPGRDGRARSPDRFLQRAVVGGQQGRFPPGHR